MRCYRVSSAALLHLFPPNFKSSRSIISVFSVILPTYNERENLPLIFYLIHKTFSSINAKFEVVIVDDNSPDETLDVARSLQSSYGANVVKIISREGKLGLGTAYIAGLEACTGNYVILMDADLSHHPKFIPKMIEKMEEEKSDIVCGTRYLRGGGVAGWDAFRKLTSRGANFLATFLLRPGPSDLTGSFRLYKKDAIKRILSKVQSKGYAFQMEILVHANKDGLKFSEIPITFVDRIYGESKLGASEILLYLKGLLKLFFTT